MATTPVYGLTKPTVGGDTGLWGGYLNTDIDTIEDVIARQKVPHNAPTVGASTTLDLSLARYFRFTVSQATTLAFSNVPSSSFAAGILLEITNGAAFTLTFPASVSWLHGSIPTFQTAGVDFVGLFTRDGGTTWYAHILNGGYSRIGAASSAARPCLVSYRNANLTTTSGSEVSLATYSLPANALAVNGQQLRITMSGIAPAGGMSINPKFGATSLTGGAQAVGGNLPWQLTITLARTGATAQVSHVLMHDNTLLSVVRATHAETLSGAVTIDFRANATVGGQTATVDSVLVEYLNS